MNYYYFTLILLILSMYISSMVRSRFNKYSQYRALSGMTGAQAAQRILHANGIYDVQIRQVQGSLTDNYNPTNKTLNLSQAVYSRNSIASIAVAAHECGHAIQHATSYGPLVIRKKLVPIANISSNFSYILILMGIAFQMSDLITVGALLFSAIVLFNFVTLPVEMDASRRALVQVTELGIQVLTAAGMTYFVSLLSAIVQLLRLLSIANRRRD